MSASSSSSDENLIVVDKDQNHYVDKMCNSYSDVDQRFLTFFKIMKKEGAVHTDAKYS